MTGLTFPTGGFLFLTLGVLLARWIAPRTVGIMIGAGWALCVFSVVLGFIVRGPVGLIGTITGGILLLWSGGTYAQFRRTSRSRVQGEQPEIEAADEAVEDFTCGPVLVDPDRSTYIYFSDKFSDWRALFMYVHTTGWPRDSFLPLRARVLGSVYYGLWYEEGEADTGVISGKYHEITKLNIRCHRRGDTCIIRDSIKGAVELLSKPQGVARIKIVVAVEKNEAEDELIAKVAMSSALEASEGPQVQLGTEGTNISVSWPDARYDITNGMESYVWRCVKETEPESEE